MAFHAQQIMNFSVFIQNTWFDTANAENSLRIFLWNSRSNVHFNITDKNYVQTSMKNLYYFLVKCSSDVNEIVVYRKIQLQKFCKKNK